ncbi:MSMEG_0570 family nitrogen starvation response protein [Acetobacter orientalis]|uniref:MSMEG_0570 family nitrogen starvation response protein n=1 Tax=Acetobacter orientalis TaxID=146474 RepID=A0A252A3M6_9PROT|nr:MSMEG_0570 family nitrogen starvation response protein [Acetobacter orientalis]OUI83369.1 hypothetical protein HK12_02595 [Acetobacter orientalis]
MPEMTFRVRWPDGKEAECYSPSLVIQDYFTQNQDYTLPDFLQKANDALTEASERVRARYGFPCSRALGQLHSIKQACAQFANIQDAQVRVLTFTL